MRLADTGVAVGGIRFIHPPEAGEVEVGYGLAESARGRGLATEALRAMTALAAQHGVAVMVAVTSVDNVASQRVLERAGFTRLLGTIQDDEDGPMLRWELLLRD